jgi:hypothetical protein
MQRSDAVPSHRYLLSRDAPPRVTPEPTRSSPIEFCLSPPGQARGPDRMPGQAECGPVARRPSGWIPAPGRGSAGIRPGRR